MTSILESRIESMRNAFDEKLAKLELTSSEILTLRKEVAELKKQLRSLEMLERLELKISEQIYELAKEKRDLVKIQEEMEFVKDAIVEYSQLYEESYPQTLELITNINIERQKMADFHNSFLNINKPLQEQYNMIKEDIHSVEYEIHCLQTDASSKCKKRKESTEWQLKFLQAIRQQQEEVNYQLKLLQQ